MMETMITIVQRKKMPKNDERFIITICERLVAAEVEERKKDECIRGSALEA